MKKSYFTYGFFTAIGFMVGFEVYGFVHKHITKKLAEIVEKEKKNGKEAEC